MFVPSEVNVEELISKYQIKSKRNFYLKKDYNNAKEKIIYFVSEGFIFNKKILQESDIKTDYKNSLPQDTIIYVRGTVRHVYNKEKMLKLYEKGAINKPWYEAYYYNNIKNKLI